MNGRLTMTSQFYVALRQRGRQQLHQGAGVGQTSGRIPRIARLMALAIQCQELIRTGVTNQSKVAGTGQITTARMTQIMSLLNLAPDVQEQLLFLPRIEWGRDVVVETDVRPIANTLDWHKQRRMWTALAREKLKSSTSSYLLGATSLGSLLPAAWGK